MTDEQLMDIVYGDAEGWSSVTEEKIIGQRRWATELLQVFKRESDGKLFEISWDQGSTEYQDDCEPCPHSCEVQPVEEVVVSYKAVEGGEDLKAK